MKFVRFLLAGLALGCVLGSAPLSASILLLLLFVSYLPKIARRLFND